MKPKAVCEWSEEDDAYVAAIPAVPGLMAHGPTRADALKAVYAAYTQWLAEISEESG